MPKKYIMLPSGRISGFIEEKAYFSKRTSDHFFRKFNGLGMSVCVLNMLRNKYRIENVYIIYENTCFKSSVQDFFDFGSSWDDNGDKQLILTINKFTKEPYKSEKTQMRLNI